MFLIFKVNAERNDSSTLLFFKFVLHPSMPSVVSYPSISEYNALFSSAFAFFCTDSSTCDCLSCSILVVLSSSLALIPLCERNALSFILASTKSSTYLSYSFFIKKLDKAFASIELVNHVAAALT